MVHKKNKANKKIKENQQFQIIKKIIINQKKNCEQRERKKKKVRF